MFDHTLLYQMRKPSRTVNNRLEMVKMGQTTREMPQNRLTQPLMIPVLNEVELGAGEEDPVGGEEVEEGRSQGGSWRRVISIS
jgi:hypothetical protein